MYEVALQDAQQRFIELLNAVANGNAVRIRRDDGTLFEIVRIVQAPPFPKFGSARGLIRMSADFDEPVEGFEEYMP